MKTQLGPKILHILVLGGIFSCNQMAPLEFECPYPYLARIDSVKQIFYSPYSNQRYASSADIIDFEEFRYHIEFEFEEIQRNDTIYNPPRNPLCEPEYDVLGISNFAIILTAPYDGIQTGTDVSYLFLLSDGESINKFRGFNKMKQFMTLKLKEKPTKISRLETELIIYLVNGDRIKKTSVSPYIKPD